MSFADLAKHWAFPYKAKPFIKWVGGKAQLLEQFEALLPQDFEQWDNVTYVEPFVGGGAMLFFMLQRFNNIKRVVINDINHTLTETYKNVKDHAEGLVFQLKQIEKEYSAIQNSELQKKYYLEIRRRFNEEELTSIERSSLLIFLNRTCFNGLYRENSKGLFNVPFGKYVNPTICNEAVIYADSELLNQYEVSILNVDFLETANVIHEGRCFYYFDPPFRPLSDTSSFNSYVKDEFGDERQKELADFCRRLSENENVKWMLSNADCSAKNPEDLFFETIYDGFNIHRVYASRSVNADPSKRGKLTELLITNY